MDHPVFIYIIFYIQESDKAKKGCYQ